MRSWIVLGLAHPANESRTLQSVESALHSGTSETEALRDVAGAELTLGRSDEVKHSLGSSRQPGGDFWVESGDVREDEPNTAALLLVHRVREPPALHLLEHPSDSFTHLLSDPQFGTHARDPRVPGEPADLKWTPRVGKSWEATGALDLDSIVVYLHSDVVATEAVRAMDDRVHQSLEPGVPRHDRRGHEATVLTERPPTRDEVLDDLLRPCDDRRDGPLNAVL